MTTTVLLADDHRMVREGLRATLARHPEIEVIAEATDGRQAVELAESRHPDVVVMDIAMPELNGIEATREISRRLPEVKVIALSMHSDKRYVVEMLRAGAAGYVLKNQAATALVMAIRSVMAGKTYLSRDVADAVAPGLRCGEDDEASAYSDLTSRERQVVQLLAEGLTSKQIAARFHLSSRTVESHRREIMRKLNVHSVAEITKYAVRQGLTPLA